MKERRYVAFEGIEGSGKSVVSKGVADNFSAEPHNMDIVHVREPGGTKIGEEIRNVLLNPRREKMSDRAEAALFAAQRAQLVESVVLPALEEGKTVLSDRSAYSSLAYQGGARGLGVEAVREINNFAIGGIWPSVVIYLRIDPDAGFAREDVRDRISAEGIDLQKRVAETYEELAENEPDKFIVIDASKPLAEVIKKTTEAILRRLK